jgi:hypothetical protein
MKIKLSILLKILIFLSNIPQFGISQPISPVGFELGISISQFHTENVIYESWETRTAKTNSIISPLIGISKEWLLRNHFQIKTELQYQMAGYKSYCLTDYVITDDYSEDWEILKIHKFCFPLTLGYQFKLYKIKPTLYLGVRPNLIVSGKINRKHHSIITRPDRIDYEDQEYDLSLFNKDGFYLNPPKRIFNQFCFGFSSSIGQRYKIDFNYSIGYNYYELIHTSTGNYGNITWSEKKPMPGCDYILVMRYLLVKLQKPIPATVTKSAGLTDFDINNHKLLYYNNK